MEMRVKEKKAVTPDHTKTGEVFFLDRKATDRQAGGVNRSLAGVANECPGRADKPSPNICPECGARMQPEGRCLTCPACGYSKCG
jgi:hypothetical protein